MSQFKLTAFRFFLIFSATCFAASAVVHILTYVAPQLLIPHFLILHFLLFLVIIPLIIVQEMDPEIRRLRSQIWFFHIFTREFHQAMSRFMEEYTPKWVKFITIGIGVYSAIQMALTMNNTRDNWNFALSDFRLFSTLWAWLYWVGTWVWHTQVVRLEKSQEQNETSTG